MVYLLIFLSVLCLLTLLWAVSLNKELKYLYRQLEQIERGSHIELVSVTGIKKYVKLCRKLNGIFSSSRTSEENYLKSQKQLKQTISNIAHDIRTPLTSAAGYLQMLQDITSEEKQLRYEDIIEKRLAELKNLLEELFLYSKLTSEEFVLDCGNIPVFPVLSDCMIGMYHMFEEKQAEPQVLFEEEELYVYGNREALGRIFRNLTNNGLIHGTGGIKVSQQGHTIYFCNSVEKADEDMEQGHLPDVSQIFERFYKADTSRRKGSSGLGLSIVKELMVQMGGEVSARLEGDELVIELHFQPPKDMIS